MRSMAPRRTTRCFSSPRTKVRSSRHSNGRSAPLAAVYLCPLRVTTHTTIHRTHVGGGRWLSTGLKVELKSAESAGDQLTSSLRAQRLIPLPGDSTPEEPRRGGSVHRLLQGRGSIRPAWSPLPLYCSTIAPLFGANGTGTYAPGLLTHECDLHISRIAHSVRALVQADPARARFSHRALRGRGKESTPLGNTSS